MFFSLRWLSLLYSIRNEKRLRTQGAVQYGKFNSFLLTLTHIAFYFSSLYEATVSETTFNLFSWSGVLLMTFAYAMLFYVIYKLRDIWTLKIYIVPNHRIEKSFLFRTVRHPNYFLNVIPELLGVALLCNARLTLCIGFPLYLVVLFVRIRQEEQAMRHLWQAA